MFQEESLPESSEIDKSNGKKAAFSHAAEETFARILDYYGIEWQYEPRTFPLRWDKQGHVNEAFTPDFYLPQQDLYIELTTLRPELTTKKNRKLARLKELYPDVNIKLFKRRELRDLLVKYGLDQEVQAFSGDRSQRGEPQFTPGGDAS